MSRRVGTTWMAVLAAAGLLAGCGGDGSNPGPSDVADGVGDASPDGTVDADVAEVGHGDAGTEDDASSDGSVPDGDLVDGGGSDAADENGGDVADGGGPGTGDGSGADGGGDPGTGTCPGAIQGAPDGGCAVEAGSGEAVRIRGTVIRPAGLLEQGEVLIDANGTIACVGCDCGDHPAAAEATVLSCPDGVVGPGLINAHDHLTFTETPPFPNDGSRWEHRHGWRQELSYDGNESTLGIVWGELRQLLGGTTSVFGSGGQPGFLRNLDDSQQLEGLSRPAATYETFPLGDVDGTTATSGCSAYDLPSPDAVDLPGHWVPHVAEGIGPAARNELTCLDGTESGAVDVTGPETALIHAVGVRAGDVEALGQEGVGVVWSPRSNARLYGMTARVPFFERLGVPIALGTDWTPSGSMDVRRELACAEHWSDTRWNGAFSDRELVAMATSRAARLLGFERLLGSIQPGLVGDVVVWDGSAHEGYRAILDAEQEEVRLVLRGGVPLYGNPEPVGALAADGACEPFEVCGASKSLCTPRELERALAEGSIGSSGIEPTFASLEEAMDDGAYPLRFCDGPPDGEPTCEPARPDAYDGEPGPDDADGDGVPDAEDNCPDRFNPPRPLDDGEQADADGDGQGDLCDPCPLTANATDCDHPDPDDRDGDGVPAPADVCPGQEDPSQTDSDGDGLGDACDPCPDQANPGGAPCPATVYDVKSGDVEPGDTVRLAGVLVTARLPEEGFFVLEDPEGEDWEGRAHAGAFVYDPAPDTPPIGARVEVQGQVSDFFGQIQIEAGEVSVLDEDAGSPAPETVEPSAVAPEGELAASREAGLVRLEGVEVAETEPDVPPDSPGDRVFRIAGELLVWDALELVQPLPEEGDTFEALTGVLHFDWGENRFVPRNAQGVTR